MPKKSEFILKDSPPELIEAAGVEPKGRAYAESQASKPGAARVGELLLGTKLACIAITDDEEDTLKKVGKANPWHIEALEMITGSEEEAHKPLTHILDAHFGLQCDEILNISGFSGGHPIDTQGYIAHNDEIVVVAFRCTTSATDWMTNLATASSAWEIDEDLEQGHSGYCSCLFDRCRKIDPDKPAVHTGFYNNIIKVVPRLEEHVNPLLAKDQPPRTLYVVGHSLGAGISTMATIYFLEHFPWKDEDMPHKLVNVSAGTPRAVKKAMGERVDNQLKELRPLDKAKICRVVMNEDVVATVPPMALGYVHVGKLVLLTEDGQVLIGPKQDDSHILEDDELRALCEANPELTTVMEEEKKKAEAAELEGNKSLMERAKTKYEQRMDLIPRPLREHCPDYYLKPLVKLYEHVHDGPGEGDGGDGSTVSISVANLPVELSFEDEERREGGQDCYNYGPMLCNK
ncbi:hypothetical protein ACHAWF_014367 [Thalassiosira exigua]